MSRPVAVYIPTYAALVEEAKKQHRHSRYGFSTAERYWNCAGSINLIATLDPVTQSAASPYAFEGTLAHLVASVRLETDQWPAGTPEEMRTDLQVYVDAVHDRIPAKRASKCQVLIEHRFELPELDPEAYGTTDAAIVDGAAARAHVGDLKFGRGKAVEVRGADGRANKQLMGYALGVLRRTDTYLEEFELFVVQPRRDHPDGLVRSITISVDELMDFENELRERIQATKKPDAPRVPGAWCDFCPAAHVCDAAQNSANAEAAMTFEPIVEEGAVFPTNYDPARLAAALDFIDTVLPWAKNVRSFAYREALAGRALPGRKLVAKRKNKVWTGDSQTVAAMLRLEFILSPEQVFIAPKLKSPAQIEKMVAKGQKKAVSGFYEKKSSGLKLVHESEPGDPVVGSFAEFDAIEEDQEDDSDE